jgi:hypothetical protein
MKKSDWEKLLCEACSYVAWEYTPYAPWPGDDVVRRWYSLFDNSSEFREACRVALEIEKIHAKSFAQKISKPRYSYRKTDKERKQ